MKTFKGKVTVMRKGGWQMTYPIVVDATNLKTALLSVIDGEPNLILNIQMTDIEAKAQRKKIWDARA